MIASAIGERQIFPRQDRKSTRLNSSHSQISYAVFCLKKKTPVDPVVQRVEAALPTPLSRSPQRTIEFSHLAPLVVGACAHALALTTMRTHDHSSGRSL